jgi:UDP-3-O-[3-hydroxymyristoyl] glucosamine N-acyltransferase
MRVAVTMLYFFSRKVIGKLQSLGTKIYTLWLIPSLGKSGGVKIFYPLLLWHGENVFMGSGCVIRPYCVVCTHPSYNGEKFCPILRIGNNCTLGMYNTINCCNRIEIGDNFLSGKNVTINDTSHGEFERGQLKMAPIDRPLLSKGAITIGRNVWVGDNVVILGNVKIGDGVIVAAGSVVIKDVPSYSLVAGVPAIVKKTLAV